MKSFVGRSMDIITIEEQKKKRIIFILAALGVILVGSLIFYGIFYWYMNRSFSSYSVKDTVSVKNGKSQKYVPYNGGIIWYGRDGITAVDEDGETVWGASYDMGNPQIDVCNQSVVVADIGGKSLYIYNGNDTGTDFEVDYPIVQACVAKQGVIGVLTEESSSNTISLYDPFDKAGKLLAEIPINVEDGYPISFDISQSGQSVVAAYLSVATGVAQSRVAFYNFSDVGKNANCMTAAQNYNDTIISEVKFLSEENACLFGDQVFYIWNNMKQPKKTVEKKFDRSIVSAFISENRVGMILHGDERNKLILYNETGKNLLNKSISQDYVTSQMCDDEIILNSSDKWYVVRTNGVVKMESGIKNQISYVFPCEKHNYYIFVQNGKLKYVKLK